MKKFSTLVAALCATTMAFAATDYSTVYTSNVTMTPDSSSAAVKVKINNESYDAVKLGTSSKTGAMTLAVPAEKNVLYLHAAAWKGSKCSIKLAADKEGVKLSTDSLVLTANAGIASNSPFTFVGEVTSDYFFTIKIDGNTEGFTLAMETVKGALRGVVWGVNADSREEVVATGIMLDKEALELEQYKSATLMATLTPEGAITDVVWTSDDEAVATVVKGKVMAMGIGMAKISATITPSEGVSYADTCVVTVKEAAAITCAKAVEIAKTVSVDNEIAAGGKYVIRGYVTEYEGTPSEDMKGYGNYSAWLADEKDGGKVFLAYQVKPLDDDKIAAVGDLVEIVGDITKYKDTYETVGHGEATIKIIEATAIRTVEVLTNVYAHNGRIYAEEGAQIYTITGLNVTEQNQTSTLNEGIYIVKANNKIAKIVVK